jgi:CRISPR-associated Csx2 family protein
MQAPHTLVSFLGKVVNGGNYRTATYQIEQQQYTQSFFGLALAQHIKPSNLLIIGTSGSMWDALIEHTADSDIDYESERLALMQAAEQNDVSQAQLDAIEPFVSAKLGVDVQLELIPYGLTIEDQLHTVSILASHIQKGQLVTLDLTHGLRHLPMLGFMSAIYLQKAKAVTIKGIYSGALDMTDTNTKITPVLNLTGLLNINDWSNALSIYDYNGDYGIFASLIEQPQISKALKIASFAQRTSQSEQARQQLSSNDALLKDSLQQNPMSALFAEALLERLTWYKKPTRGEREAQLAWQYLETNDFARSAIYAFEAYITRQLEKDRQDTHDYDVRKQVSDQQAKESNDIRMLRSIRNGLAHGVRPNSKSIQQLMNDENKLKSTLFQLYKTLFE